MGAPLERSLDTLKRFFHGIIAIIWRFARDEKLSDEVAERLELLGAISERIAQRLGLLQQAGELCFARHREIELTSHKNYRSILTRNAVNNDSPGPLAAIKASTRLELRLPEQFAASSSPLGTILDNL